MQSVMKISWQSYTQYGPCRHTLYWKAKKTICPRSYFFYFHLHQRSQCIFINHLLYIRHGCFNHRSVPVQVRASTALGVSRHSWWLRQSKSGNIGGYMHLGTVRKNSKFYPLYTRLCSQVVIPNIFSAPIWCSATLLIKIWHSCFIGA